MVTKKNIEKYSEAEIRKFLLEKIRSTRHERLNQYYQPGRAIRLIADAETTSLEDFHTDESIENDPNKTPVKKRKRKRFFDRTFLLVELGILIVLLFILFTGIDSLRQVNQNSVNSLLLPSLTPTPLIRAVVLPSGHTPPTSIGGARPNDAEIPDHLRPLVQTYNNIPIPTPAHEHATRIQIPTIDIDAPVIQGTGWEQLKKGVGQVIGTANPGKNGNLVLSAHNDIFGEFFRYLDRLQPGDQFTVYTNLRSFTYEVKEWEVVEPSRVDVMNPTPNATATLISCYPYLVDNLRIIVRAELLES